MPIQTINPATGTIEKTFTAYSAGKVEEIIENADAAFQQWRNVDLKNRTKLINNAADILRREKNNFGKIITLEMGKPLSQAIAEIEKCAWICDYYAENAERFLHEEKVNTEASESYIRFDPLGVILAVMPWNFPFLQVFRFAAPALTAGNAAVLKHASNVPLCAIEIEKIFSEAGFPENVFRTLLIGPELVEDIINHPKIKAVTLTGSEQAGRQIAAASGKALKKTVLELGGSDPFIVLEDADLDAAVRTAVNARLSNCGQSCIAAKRFVVVESVFKEFESKFVALMKQVKIGDPMEAGTEVGPLARKDILATIEKQIQSSVANGAEVLCGGHRLKRPGYYFEPTILVNVKKGMPAYDEEMFGPVAALIPAKNAEDAMKIANDSEFGLGASLWTKDITKARMLATKLENGVVFINAMVKSDPRLAFGGVKHSGYGRELAGYGIKEFVNVKTVWIN